MPKPSKKIALIALIGEGAGPVRMRLETQGPTLVKGAIVRGRILHPTLTGKYLDINNFITMKIETIELRLPPLGTIYRASRVPTSSSSPRT